MKRHLGPGGGSSGSQPSRRTQATGLLTLASPYQMGQESCLFRVTSWFSSARRSESGTFAENNLRSPQSFGNELSFVREGNPSITRQQSSRRASVRRRHGGCAGLALASEHARRGFVPGGINRVVLATSPRRERPRGAGAVRRCRAIFGLGRGSWPATLRSRPIAPVEKANLAELMQSTDFIWKSGAGEGIRTLDPNLGKVVLYP